MVILTGKIILYIYLLCIVSAKLLLFVKHIENDLIKYTCVSTDAHPELKFSNVSVQWKQDKIIWAETKEPLIICTNEQNGARVNNSEGNNNNRHICMKNHFGILCNTYCKDVFGNNTFCDNQKICDEFNGCYCAPGYKNQNCSEKSEFYLEKRSSTWLRIKVLQNNAKMCSYVKPTEDINLTKHVNVKHDGLSQTCYLTNLDQDQYYNVSIVYKHSSKRSPNTGTLDGGQIKTKCNFSEISPFRYSTTCNANSCLVKWKKISNCSIELFSVGYNCKYTECDASSQQRAQTWMTTNSYIIKDLLPLSKYTITLYAESDNHINTTETETIRTSHLETWKNEDIKISSQQIALTQTPCNGLYGKVSCELTFTCLSDMCNNSKENFYLLSNDRINDKFIFRIPKLNYTETVYSLNMAILYGDPRSPHKSEYISNYTSPINPPNKVEDLIAYSKNESSIWLRWKPPNGLVRNISHYNVSVILDSIIVLSKDISYISMENCLWKSKNYICCFLHDLEPKTDYLVTVKSKYEDGNDEWGIEASCHVNTVEKQSKPPQNLIIDNNVICFDQPFVTNGPIKYFLITITDIDCKWDCQMVHNETITQENLSYSYELKNLKPLVTYKVSVAAVNKYFGKKIFATVKNFPAPQFQVVYLNKLESKKSNQEIKIINLYLIYKSCRRRIVIELTNSTTLANSTSIEVILLKNKTDDQIKSCKCNCIFKLRKLLESIPFVVRYTAVLEMHEANEYNISLQTQLYDEDCSLAIVVKNVYGKVESSKLEYLYKSCGIVENEYNTNSNATVDKPQTPKPHRQNNGPCTHENISNTSTCSKEECRQIIVHTPTIGADFILLLCYSILCTILTIYIVYRYKYLNEQPKSRNEFQFQNVNASTALVPTVQVRAIDEERIETD